MSLQEQTIRYKNFHKNKQKEKLQPYLDTANQYLPSGTFLGDLATAASVGNSLGGLHGAAIGAGGVVLLHGAKKAYDKYRKNKRNQKQKKWQVKDYKKK